MAPIFQNLVQTSNVAWRINCRADIQQAATRCRVPFARLGPIFGCLFRALCDRRHRKGQIVRLASFFTLLRDVHSWLLPSYYPVIDASTSPPLEEGDLAHKSQVLQTE